MRNITRKRRFGLMLLVGIILVLASTLSGQVQYEKQESAVPILTGFAGLTTSFVPEQQQLSPTISPIILVPFGERWLIETEAEFAGNYTHMTDQPWDRHWDKGIEYLQVDFFANKYLTVVGGRFLTPFGIFNERLHSGWIRNLPAEPLIAGIEMSDSNGGMLRGGVSLSQDVNMTYAGFFSAASTARAFLATRAAGGRVSLFFPKQRFEFGTSYQRRLQDSHVNTFGADVTWQLTRIPLDFRSEYAHSEDGGSGYWVEAAYRTRKVPFAKAFFSKSQAIIRMEQFFVPAGSSTGIGGDMPTVDTQRFSAGWNYWIRPDVRSSFSYARSLSSESDHNIWQIGITYRFALPLFGGRK